MSLIRKHVAVLQAWACLDLVQFCRWCVWQIWDLIDDEWKCTASWKVSNRLNICLLITHVFRWLGSVMVSDDGLGIARSLVQLPVGSLWSG